MAVTSFRELLGDAQKKGYALGYFESWNLESLLAAADAAEEEKSPVILGFSGIFLPHTERVEKDGLSCYAALGLEVCRSISVPCCLLFNESANMQWVEKAVDLGFHCVMFTDENCSLEEQTSAVRSLVEKTRGTGTAVEGELTPLPGAGLKPAEMNEAIVMTDPEQARKFVGETGIDACAVDIGQIHLHGAKMVHLDLDHLRILRGKVPVPLVLHGASSVAESDLAAAAGSGIAKINVGSSLKRVYFEALKRACREVSPDYNPYTVMGSGLPGDVLIQARKSLKEKIKGYMRLFGSSGKAV